MRSSSPFVHHHLFHAFCWPVGGVGGRGAKWPSFVVSVRPCFRASVLEASISVVFLASGTAREARLKT